MAVWAADYDAAFEVTEPAFNLVLDRILATLPGKRVQYGLGIFGSVTAELTDIEVLDIRPDPVAPPGVITDLRVEVDFDLRLFGFIRARTPMVFMLQGVELDLSRTPGGLPRGLVLAVTPQLAVSMTFPQARGLIGAFLNSVIGRLVSLGVWLAFRLIQRVEIPIWPLVDVFAVLGLQMTQVSPWLTAQSAAPPSSALLGTDFVLQNAAVGDPNRFGHFLPANTNIGAVLHEVLLSAAVNIARAKGWAPSRVRAGGWRIYITSLAVDFQPGKIRVFGSIRAKRGRCWCKVKVTITYDVAVEPKVQLVPPTPPATAPRPELDVVFDANINVHVSTSGMLALLGTIIAAPLFLALTIAASFLINIALQQFLPFTMTFANTGTHLQISVNSVHFSGVVPFSMSIPLALTGRGQADLAPWTQFSLGPSSVLNVGYLPTSLEINDEELRLAVELS